MKVYIGPSHQNGKGYSADVEDAYSVLKNVDDWRVERLEGGQSGKLVVTLSNDFELPLLELDLNDIGWKRLSGK